MINSNKINIKNTNIIIVNYNTPDLLLRLYNQIRKKIGDILIFVVDGSDSKIIKRGESIILLNDLMIEKLQKDGFVVHKKLNYNIHHGPGMDLGINLSNSKYVLIMDSDTQITKNPFQLFNKYFKKDFTCMGKCEWVNKNGVNVNKDGFPYIHPYAMLLDRIKYIDFNYKFIKHGAPCINFFLNIKEKELIKIEYAELEKYFKRGIKGTVDHFGYNL